jgi:D-serine dehydratase
VEDFEGLTEAIDAKRRLMERWRDKGVCYQAAVIEYAHEYSVTVERGVQAVNDMEVLTGIRLERQ